MPPTTPSRPAKPTLIDLHFAPTSKINEGANETRWEVEATWSGSPEPRTTYLGILVRTREVDIRDDDGTELIRCHLDTMPITAHFALPAADRNAETVEEIATAKRTAEKLIVAAYQGCGYRVAPWMVQLLMTQKEVGR
jgi:hypothetical protein